MAPDRATSCNRTIRSITAHRVLRSELNDYNFKFKVSLPILPPLSPERPRYTRRELCRALRARPRTVCYHGTLMQKSEGSGEGNSGWVTTDVAAEVLSVSARSVRNYILNHTLVARKETEGINERYLISLESLNTLRDRRKSQGKLRGKHRVSPPSEGAVENTAEVVKETAVDMLRETLANLERHIATNAELRVAGAELRARLEVSERAESALREELEGERRRHEENVERERSGRLEAQERAEHLAQEHARVQGEIRDLRQELEAERSKGFWRRLFGS